MSEKNTSNQQDTTKQNEKYDVVYNKNSGYSQSEVTKLIKIYHMAMAAGDNVTVQDAYTKIYFFIAKYVYKTLWGNYHTLMQNKYHREDIVINAFFFGNFFNDSVRNRHLNMQAILPCVIIFSESFNNICHLMWNNPNLSRKCCGSSNNKNKNKNCLLYTSPSPRDA